VLVGVLARGTAGGAYFAATLAAYTLVREALLRLRIERVRTRLRVPVTAVASAFVLVAAVVVVAL